MAARRRRPPLPLKTTAREPVDATGKKRGGVTGKGFLPGQSGNPGGRPRSEKKLLERLFGETGEALYLKLKAMLEHQKTPAKVRADIAMFLIERLHGRPQQTIDLEAKLYAEVDALALVMREDIARNGHLPGPETDR